MEVNESFAAAALAAPPEIDPSLPLGPRRQAKARAVKPGVKREAKAKAKDAPNASPLPVAKTAGDGGQDGAMAPVVVVAQDEPRVPVVRVGSNGKGKGKVQAVGKRGEENQGKVGRPPRTISEADRKKCVRAIALGMPVDRAAMICGFPASGGGAWQRYLDRNPAFQAEIDRAKGHGEADLLLSIDDGLPGWQGKAWLLERARGYTMRAGIEHSGPGGRPLSVVAQVFATLEAPGK